jgi:CRP-like cAMP-binding protein
MTSDERILQYLSRYIKLDKKEQHFFTGLLDCQEVKKGTPLLKPGEICRQQYFVVEGCLRTYTVDEQGQEHIIQFSQSDWWTSDLYSGLTQTPAEHGIDAVVPSNIIMLPFEKMEWLYAEVPKFERFFRILYQNAIVSHFRRTRESMELTAEERYIRFTERYPDLQQLVPQKHIASYLNMTPEFLSKIRHKLAHR